MYFFRYRSGGVLQEHEGRIQKNTWALSPPCSSDLTSRDINMVQGFHPRYSIRYKLTLFQDPRSRHTSTRFPQPKVPTPRLKRMVGALYSATTRKGGMRKEDKMAALSTVVPKNASSLVTLPNAPAPQPQHHPP